MSNTSLNSSIQCLHTESVQIRSEANSSVHASTLTIVLGVSVLLHVVVAVSVVVFIVTKKKDRKNINPKVQSTTDEQYHAGKHEADKAAKDSCTDSLLKEGNEKAEVSIDSQCVVDMFQSPLVSLNGSLNSAPYNGADECQLPESNKNSSRSNTVPALCVCGKNCDTTRPDVRENRDGVFGPKTKKASVTSPFEGVLLANDVEDRPCWINYILTVVRDTIDIFRSSAIKSYTSPVTEMNTLPEDNKLKLKYALRILSDTTDHLKGLVRDSVELI